ncbi:hypothetical protein FHR81_002666 [Actinoalloteichus hoggarensis]|uniref:hypothetical protein n=1 Tax=Actinoalloteichus hoggarensis TaxID=1470176 RepID=UPI0012FE1095|nr:hypothetical protein [Actinoalloteichus hoggarensis]MBB5921626.1 hypothetical protein [Actinoalloteichus hoggarensis]
MAALKAYAPKTFAAHTADLLSDQPNLRLSPHLARRTTAFSPTQAAPALATPRLAESATTPGGLGMNTTTPAAAGSTPASAVHAATGRRVDSLVRESAAELRLGRSVPQVVGDLTVTDG